MKFPCQRLHLCGDILLAARGARINTFNAQDGSQLGTWARPSESKAVAEAEEEKKTENGASAPAANEETEQGPPAKRRKVDEEGGQAETVEETGAQDQSAGKQNGKGQKGKKKEWKGQAPARVKSAIPDTPFITLMAATTDGKHIAAITSPDKVLWVLEHDGNGNLRELSQRPMPKRPCAIAISPDNKTIISADKFGDVYSLPLIPSEQQPPAPPAQVDTPTPEPTTPSTPTNGDQTPSSSTTATFNFKSTADTTTVHTKRNLRALRHQALYGSTYQKRAEGPAFEHSLLLGHVSMLTSMVLATSSSRARDYIITADRDEHIRVSRAPPHAHVIETFCLGHDAFVSALCLAPGRPEVLVSGGGDDALYVWLWEEGRLCGTAGLLEHARRADEGVSKVAVTGLYALSRGDGQECTFFVMCERIQAIFAFTLSESNTLVYTHTTKLPGVPLDAVVYGQGTPDARLLVSVDGSSSSDGEVPSVVQLQQGSDKTWTASAFALQEQEAQGESSTLDLTAEELHKLLYTTETLRKSEMEEGTFGNGDADAATVGGGGEVEQ